jgi:mono/diheme cytochrome c family protein
LAGVPPTSTAVLSDTTAASPTFDADLAGTYILNLVVNDGLVNSISDTMTVTASDIPPSNTAPVADAGNNQNVATGDTVTLDGSNSSDADSDLLTYTWSITASPNGSSAALSDATAAGPTFAADLAGTYTVELVVNDGTVNSNTDVVTITAADSVQAVDGQLVYDNNCSGCHGLGTYDTSGFPDLDGKGSALAGKFTADVSSHKGITLTQAEMDGTATFLGP